MKTTKSSDSEEVTPSKKILKQARLPFKILSTEDSPKSVPQTRKRKLSVTESEVLTKVGKITKHDSTEELVLISDDDSQNSAQKQVETKTLNPFVRLVNTARKKKLQKTKTKKKKQNVKKPLEDVIKCNSENHTDTTIHSVDTDDESVTEMEVETEDAKCSNTFNNTSINDNTQLIHNKKENDQTLSCNESHANVTCENLSNKCDPVNPTLENDVIDNIIISPKRVTRSKLNEEKSLNTSQLSNCEESDFSPTTPRRSNRSLSVTNSNEDVPVNESLTTNLTPKQLQKKLESAKKRDEREKERIEREKKRQQEKEERAKQRQEKEEQRKKEKEEKEEVKKKEREEKEEQKKKEREEKEKQKELEKKLREEKEDQKRKEKEEKDEQKRKEREAREEERKKKQEALELEKQDQEQKKKKAAEAFVSFFVPKQKAEKDQAIVCTVSQNEMLSSFTIKADMRLAPTTRVQLTESSKEELDNLLKVQNCEKNSLYIKSLKNGTKSLSSGKTWPLCDKDDDDDVMIIEDELPPDGASEILSLDPAIRETLRPKLLAFHENRRPPYWGTWRKKSNSIKPKQPFKMDQKLLDYDVDSDDDWEEEQEGESIDGSAAGSDDEQDPDEYEVDNDVFVPHGYLSDEEATMDEDDVLSLSPESQKARLKHLEDEFESEMKKPMEKLKPRLYGLLWETADGGKPENCADALWSYFGKLAMVMNDPTPFLQPSNDQEETEKKKVKKKKVVATEDEQKSPKSDKKKKSKNDKEGKKPKPDIKKNVLDPKKNQPGINTFLTKLKGL